MSDRTQIIILWMACLMLLGVCYWQSRTSATIISLTEYCSQGKPKKVSPKRTYLADYDSLESIVAADAALRAMIRKEQRDNRQEQRNQLLW